MRNLWVYGFLVFTSGFGVLTAQVTPDGDESAPAAQGRTIGSDEHEGDHRASPRRRLSFGFGRTGAYFQRDDGSHSHGPEPLPRYRPLRRRGLRLSIGVGAPYRGYPYAGYGYDGYPYERLWFDNIWYPGFWLNYDRPVWDEHGYPDGFSYDDYGDAGYYRGGVRRSGMIQRGPNSYIYGPLDEREEDRDSPRPRGTAPGYFREQALAAFRQGRYDLAIRHARHALVDEPDSALVYALISQTQFAQREYRRAAETLHALSALPAEDWGGFIQNYRNYYASAGDYTQQLRYLERFVKDNPTEPYGPLLLGYHYGYLGYPHHALGELQKAAELAQADPLPGQLIEVFSRPQAGEAVRTAEPTEP